MGSDAGSDDSFSGPDLMSVSDSSEEESVPGDSDGYYSGSECSELEYLPESDGYDMDGTEFSEVQHNQFAVHLFTQQPHEDIIPAAQRNAASVRDPSRTVPKPVCGGRSHQWPPSSGAN